MSYCAIGTLICTAGSSPFEVFFGRRPNVEVAVEEDTDDTDVETAWLLDEPEQGSDVSINGFFGPR